MRLLVPVAPTVDFEDSLALRSLVEVTPDNEEAVAPRFTGWPAARSLRPNARVVRGSGAIGVPADERGQRGA